MKALYSIGIVAVAVLLLAGCQENTPDVGTGTGELALLPSVGEMEEVSLSRASGNTFFSVGYGINISIEDSKGGEHDFVYTYGSDGVFRGNPGYRFNLDDTHISSLTAIWPTQEIRNEGILTDQRDYEDFRLADWLTATASTSGIMPTDTPVPLEFERENTMLEFELVGQNADGIGITSLLLELDIKGVSTACWAYCGSGNGHAYLILDGGTKIVSSASYMIGTITVTEGDTYYIIFPQANITLEDGKKYLVTLTSQGYDMDPYVYIGGWAQAEGGIGVPFTEPKPDLDGNYIIETPQQLIAMSFMIRHYYDSDMDWTSRNYILADDFQMTEEAAALYIPVPVSEFNGTLTQNGASVTEVTYGNGLTLQIFDNENSTQP